MVYISDGYDLSDIKYDWFDMYTGENHCQHDYCMHLHVYDKEMSNFDLIKARKSRNKTNYHASKKIYPLFTFPEYFS